MPIFVVGIAIIIATLIVMMKTKIVKMMTILIRASLKVIIMTTRGINK